MHLVRCLFFIAAMWDILLVACHIPGSCNLVADAISRDNLSVLFLKVPRAQRQPTPVPRPQVELLITVQPDWTSENWRRLFKNSLQWV